MTALRACASTDCSNWFDVDPCHAWQKYCCVTCKNREASRQRYRDSKWRCIAANLKSHFKHHEERLSKQRQRYYLNIKMERIRCRIYALTHPEKGRERSRVSDGKRRERKRSAGDKCLTTEQWLVILQFWGGKCAYCNAGGKMTMDHVVPLACGGEHTVDNVVPACASCNSRKGCKSVEEFLELPKSV